MYAIRSYYDILVQLDLDDETWHIVNDTAKVTGFLGGRRKPTPLSDDEAARILNRMEAGKLKPQPKYFFEHGDEVRVIDGPFTNFNGTVHRITSYNVCYTKLLRAAGQGRRRSGCRHAGPGGNRTA